MIEPTTALQIAIRSALIDTPAVLALVPADHIRSGSTRPDKTPAIIMSDGTTELHGRYYTAQRAARVFLDIHCWDLNDGPDAAKAISFAVTQALDSTPAFDGCDCDDFRVTRVVHVRDPQPEHGHSVLSIEALIRWSV